MSRSARVSSFIKYGNYNVTKTENKIAISSEDTVIVFHTQISKLNV